jgi:hypothetical protein
MGFARKFEKKPNPVKPDLFTTAHRSGKGGNHGNRNENRSIPGEMPF